jgi:hypothetical protein
MPRGTRAILYTEFIFVWTKLSSVQQKLIFINTSNKKSPLPAQKSFVLTKFSFVHKGHSYCDKNNFCCKQAQNSTVCQNLNLYASYVFKF